MYIKMKNKRGQSTVEYILLVTAVLAVVIVFATNKNGGFQTQMNMTLNEAVGQINQESQEFDQSHTLSPVSNVAPAVPYTVNAA